VQRVSTGARETGEANVPHCGGRELTGRELELAGAVAGGRGSI